MNLPEPNIVKSARIDYTIGGVPGSVSVAENDTLDLSATKAQDVKYALVQEPPAHLAIVSWTPGTLTAKDSAGKTITRQISAPPKPIEIEGAWTVHFDPRWGGPQTVMFDSLVDWTKRPEPGIKYYSGTAEYDKTIDVPDGWVKAGRAIYLDLGDLESLANVTLNGQYVGCLWSAPYRADVSGILKPGANQLQIKVTDTWVNRLIGDDGLPSNQRIASTTQQFYSPTDPLIPSGLFGPVTLVGADPVAL